MSTPEVTRDRDERTAAGVTERNIGLTFDLARAIATDSALLAEIPDGATVILLPDDDPELAARNLAGGCRRVRAGENVYFRHVRQRASTISGGE